VVGALCAWGIAIPDPLVTSREVEELKGVRLETASGIVNRGQVVHGATVRNVTFSQVALLNEIQQGCGERLEQAKALIGLVLSYIAPNDGGWRTEREVKANTGASIRLCPAIWLADLLNPSRAWVPSPGADGSHVALAATSTSIGPLLDSRWLNEASIELLSKHFGFGRLELQLLVASPDEAKRSDLKDALARLVEVGGANAGFYTELAGRVEEQKRRERELNRLRNMGLAVQGAVESAMKAHRLQLKFEDCGFDYEVSEDPIADPSIRMQFGTYLLEVKATTTGEVRLTSKQAATASEEANRFVLCVVDLRGMPLEELDRTWTPQDVEPRAKILAGVGSKVATPHGLVEAASTSEVRVRNESALRYAVSDELWFAGISISAWVEGIRASLKPSAAG
jgi:hypothetical protein